MLLAKSVLHIRYLIGAPGITRMYNLHINIVFKKNISRKNTRTKIQSCSMTNGIKASVVDLVLMVKLCQKKFCGFKVNR